MKKVIFGLICLFLASQVFVSCSSESDVLSQFSKRKYLKKFKSKDVKYEDKINKYDNDIDYTASINEFNYPLDEVEANDNSVMIELEQEGIPQLNLVKENTKDYSEWNKYDREMDFSKLNLENNYVKNEYNKISSSKRVSEVVIGIFCFFIPCVGVLLFENSITNNFWVSIIGMILFYIPGIVFAFLVCFGGVSVN